MNNTKGKFITFYCIGLIYFLVMLILPLKAFAHGIDISAVPAQSIVVTVLYDSGLPMAGAQVNVYAPDNLLEPWLTGTCDQEGRFIFVPDYSRPGLWEVQVRLAGHADLIRIEVQGDETPSAVEPPGCDDLKKIEVIGDEVTNVAETSGLSILQKVIIALSVLWGAAGTALYFNRRSN